MNKKTIYNILIIDSSGSMWNKAHSVREGIKQTFKDIKKLTTKKLKSHTIVTSFSSNDNFKVLVNSSNLKDLVPEIASNYLTDGFTALFDSIGKTFSIIPDNTKDVLVTIITDGAENDSKEFNRESIKTLIESKRALGWGITFMGAGEGFLKEAESIGISKGNVQVISNNSKGVNTAFNTGSNVRGLYYSSVTNNLSINTDNLISTLQDNE